MFWYPRLCQQEYWKGERKGRRGKTMCQIPSWGLNKLWYQRWKGSGIIELINPGLLEKNLPVRGVHMTLARQAPFRKVSWLRRSLQAVLEPSLGESQHWPEKRHQGDLTMAFLDGRRDSSTLFQVQHQALESYRMSFCSFLFLDRCHGSECAKDWPDICETIVVW